MRATAAVACAVCVALLAPMGAGAAPSRNTARAVAGFVAMERNLFDAGSGTYRETYAWPVSQAVAATIAVARIPGAKTDAARFSVRGFEQLGSLRQGALYRANAGGAVFFDDNGDRNTVSTANDPVTGLFSQRLLGQAAFVQLYAQLALMGSEAAGSPSPQRATAPTNRR